MTVETERTGTTWHCVHVYYYDPDKDRLILDAVRPLFQQLRSRVDALSLARHWRQGPHLRLFAKTDPRTWADVVRPRVDAVIGDYLAAHPSAAEPDLEHDLAQHRLLARREQEIGPLTPWFPDNSIREQPYDTRSHVIRSAETRELVASFAADGTHLLFRMLDRVRGCVDVKELIALELLLATTVAACTPVTAGFTSYRSHAEGFLHSCGDPEAVREAFDAHYEAHRATLVARTRDVLATLDSATNTTPYARRWASLCREYGRRVAPLVERGLVFPPLPAAFGDPALLRYRFLLHCTYLQISRLGLTPFQRLRTCHAAANAVEEIHGTSAVDALRTDVELHPNVVS